MQKLLTIAIDIEELKERSSGAFTITEVEGVNALLQEGWMIQEWEFLTNETEEEKAIVMLILGEEQTEEDFEDSLYSAAEETDEDEDFEEAESINEEQSDEQSEVKHIQAQTDVSMN